MKNSEIRQFVLKAITIGMGAGCIVAGIFMAYQGKIMPIANVSIPAGLIFLIAGLILFGVALSRPTRQEQQWWESKWISTLIIIILGAVVFGIVQPFIWQWVHKETPPPGTVDLANLLTIILALIALTVTGFAILAYRDLRHRLRESLGREITNKSNIALARARGSVAYGLYRTWLLTRRVDKMDHELINTAIRTQIRALRLVEEMSKEEYEKLPDEVKEAINQQKSNLAGYIVYNLRFHLEKISKDRMAEQLNIARKYGKQAYDEATKFGDKYDWKANYAAMLINFGTNDEKNLARQIISELKQRYAKGEIPSQKMKDYYDLFGFEKGRID